MDTRSLKIDLIHWLENLQDVSVLQQIASLKSRILEDSHQQNIDFPGKPMSLDEFKNRILSAKSRINNGQFTTMENLEKEMESWD